ncbi:tetratricopeptide repeat protein [Haliangium ochraceum]|uniref:Tetratricopeptide TPR_2 repeat protein n=1 Tax=Haliangium ochraceum (strain DSM 14365 / JCM 11303 / SMP-2) TaxID=502025 RepID=D0LKI0_HALO1|nr:tetratricopeptide repeat protein [Haliangium ochraceum]ACY15028.1 Tetratricopeptide TPR_2 repeat protein [Haliangium ochraceum DSM 14365]
MNLLQTTTPRGASSGARAMRSLLLGLACAAAALAAGCGGGSKAGAGGGTGPGGTDGSGSGGAERELSSDARADYEVALGYFKEQDAGAWSRDACEQAASKFEEVASDHPKLIEARYMRALSYDRCSMSEQAEDAYKDVLKANNAHALSISNLGTLYFKRGEVGKAKEHWEKAIDTDSKIVAARNNLAWLLLEDMRKTDDQATWKKLEEAASKHLSSALAVNSELVETYVLFGLLYLEGSERNRNRLDLANLLLEEGEKRSENYPPLYNARGLLQMKRNNLGEALANFQKAVTLDENFSEARVNVGNIALGFRKYEEAEAQFTQVLAKEKLYEAQLGLGIAQRGLGKLSEAEDSYKKAIEMDGSQGAPYFNLGVLYKDFYANKASDLKESKQAYETARGHFKTYLSKGAESAENKQEAEDNIADCDKIIKQLDEVIKATAQG